MEVPGRSIHGKHMEQPSSDESVYALAMDAIEACSRTLFDDAVRIQDDYLSFVDGVEAKAKGWESRSNLQLSCTKKGNSLDLKWTGIKWYGPKANRVSMRVPIKKNSDGFSYGTDKLKVYAKDWELDKVVETEKKLQVVRRKAKHLVNAAASIRNVMRFPKDGEEGSGSTSD